MAAAPEQLSDTLEGVANELSGPCTAGEIVQRILARHEDYATGQAKRIAETIFSAPDSRRQPVRAWYDSARFQLKDDLGKLSGKTAILGLAVADRTTGREVIRSGLFACLLSIVTEGIDLFNARGRERLATMPRAYFGAEITPIVLRRPGRPGIRGGLAPDGSRAVGYGHDPDRNEITLWAVESAVPIGRLRPSKPVRMVRFSADGSRIVALLGDGSIVRWRTYSIDRGADDVTPPIPGFESGALSTDSRCAVVRLNGPGFTVIDLENGQRADVPTESRLSRVSVSADGRWIAVASGRTGGLYERTGTSVQLVRPLAAEHDIRALECGAGMAVVSAGGTLTVVGEREIRIPAKDVERVVLSGDGSLLAWVGQDRLTLAQPAAAVELGSLPATDGVVRSTLSLDGRRLLASHADGTMRVWDVGLEPPATRPPPATFDSDVADDERDFLDRRGDVDAFASLIAAKTVQPPMSIGVFGDWGSGKSWFMGQLKRRVEQIASDTRASGARQTDVSFYKHIAQVQFNAWHYAETDVLSSLVDHVFNRLDVGEVTDAFEAGLVAGQTELAEAGLAEKKAATALGTAESELAALAESRRIQEEQRAAAAAALRANSAPSAMDDVLSKADGVLEQIGWTGVSGAATEFVAALRSQRAELERANVLLSPLVRGKDAARQRHRRRAVFWIFVLPLVALVVGAAIGLVDDESMAALAGAGAFLAGLLGGLTRVVSTHTRWVHDRLQELADAEREIETRVATELKELDDSIAKARAQEIDQTKKVTAQRQRLDEAKQVVNEKRELLLRREQPDRMLEDLVNARIESGEYARRLGVVALARRDFEKVSDLIRAVNESMEGPSAPPGDEEKSKINRIVLYIDDLDRCEPDKVAKVLQAVHLLLAFPLFVVVVGVDPRWVGRALKKQYPELLDGAGVEPNDYLEKIFQIPFWLKPLNNERTTSMLRGLAGAPAGSDRRPARTRAATGGAGTNGTGSDGTGSDGTAGAGSSDGDSGAGQSSTDPTSTDPSSPGNVQLARSRELNPRGLLLGPHEVEAMGQLSGLLGRSPRALKRFVNVYRLFKVREPDVVDFADPDRPDADYRIVLYLLAEITGRPDTAGDLFTRIRNAADGDSAVLENVPEGWPRTAGAYKPWLEEVGRFSFRAITGADRAGPGPAATADHAGSVPPSTADPDQGRPA